MEVYEFKSAVISTEFNLTEISKHFVINKKFKWEEPLILDEKYLRGIISFPENKFVYIYHFGSIVSVNLTLHEIKDIIAYLKNIDKNFRPNPTLGYIEEFKLIIDENLNTELIEDVDFELNYDSIVIKSLENFHMGILATILARSVALRRIEDDIDILLDELENIINFLDQDI